MHDVATNLNALRAELNSYFLERSDPIEASLLALVSGHHVFLLGPPGTAKTQMIRCIVRALVNARYFEVSLSRNRPMEAVVGPLDHKHYRETGDFRYKRDGYATQCDVILLNEIGKMSDDVGHDLLKLLNEREYDEVSDGKSVHPAPLSTAFCDSNELLGEQSDDAAALWDRLLVRSHVDYIKDDHHFAQLLSAGAPQIETRIEWKDLLEVTASLDTIAIPSLVMSAVAKLRRELSAQGINPSTRRWKQSMDVLRASAFLAGRDEVAEDDLVALRFTLWDTVEQIEIVDRACRSASNPFVAPLLAIEGQILEVVTAIDERLDEFTKAGSDWDTAQGSALQQYSKEATKKLGTCRDKLDSLLMEASGRAIPGFKKVSDLHYSTLVGSFMTCLGQDNTAAEIMADKRKGAGDGGNTL